MRCMRITAGLCMCLGFYVHIADEIQRYGFIFLLFDPLPTGANAKH